MLQSVFCSRYLYTALGQEWTGRHYVRGRLYGDQTLFLHPDHDKLDLLLALGWNGWSSHGMPQTRRFIKSLSEDPDRTLVVVDPRPSETAQYADIHLALTPGSDALLLKAMIAIILKEGWHNRSFLESHTTGWEETVSLFSDFPVKDALQVCGLEFDQVKEAMARVGFPEGEDQVERVYGAIMDHPEGNWLGQLDPEKNLEFVSTEDSRIHLHAPELVTWFASVTPEDEKKAMAPDAVFPLILMAGWHYDHNANTLMRDPAWNRGRRTGCLAIHPRDAADLDLADGEMARLTTQAGEVTVVVQISKLTRTGMVLLPQGFGLVFEGKSVGVNVNLLTPAGHRDRIAGTPYHRRVPCRLEKVPS